MRAAELPGYKEPFALAEVPTPAPGPGEVLVRVAGAGVCHSDLHLWSGELPMVPSFPWILGHENAGYVDALGPGAEGVELGEPVAVFGGWGCGACRVCLAGEEQLCDVTRWAGIGRPGGYAEHVLVPAVRHLVPLGDLDPTTAATLTDAGLTPYRAVRKGLSRLHPGATAVTIGVGGLGQYGLQYLKLLSRARVVAVDTSSSKRRLASTLGADRVVDPTDPDSSAHIDAATASRGAAVVIDYVGSNESLALAASVVGRQGIVIIVGLAGGSLPASFLGLPTEAIVTSSYWGSRNELADVIALAHRGLLHHEVETAPLDDINEVFNRLERGEITGRMVLTP